MYYVKVVVISLWEWEIVTANNVSFIFCCWNSDFFIPIISTFSPLSGMVFDDLKESAIPSLFLTMHG